METENVSPRFRDLDAWPSDEALRALYEGQLSAVAAVRPALPAIEAAAEKAAARLAGSKGRLVYVGAGTSGRIGVQDGAELPPTFDWPEERVVFAMAGGTESILRALENVEDSAEGGEEQMAAANIGREDVVIGVAASGTTPYTLAALQAAAKRGALTIGIANNRGTPLLDVCQCPILVETGEEVIAGSTRMKAGTAQKIVLNLFSTMVMIRLGRVYGGMMIDMRATNAKLRLRAEEMVVAITGCERPAAVEALARADGEVKLAAMLVSGVDRRTAETILERCGGNLRKALTEIPAGPADARGRLRHG